jgi:hypothetical protein
MLFNENILTYVKGSNRDLTKGWFNVHYNPQNQLYELEIKIKLNRVGNYQFFTSDRIDFLGTPMCNRYFIETKIMGNVDNVINFTVE